LAGARMRFLRRLEIVVKGGQIRRINSSTFLVKSQSGNKYKVKWVCNCPGL